MDIENIVINLLNNHPEYLNNDRELIWAVWQEQRVIIPEMFSYRINKKLFLNRAFAPELILEVKRKYNEKKEK